MSCRTRYQHNRILAFLLKKRRFLPNEVNSKWLQHIGVVSKAAGKYGTDTKMKTYIWPLLREETAIPYRFQ